MRALILQLSKSSIYSTKPFFSRKDADFPFTIYPATLARVPYFSVPSELQLHYFHTKIDILLGNQHYYLIVPGVDEGSSENPLINPPIYSEHLHYHFHAPRQKAAWVVLVLNRAQGNMTIDCVNDQVNWLIDVSHINDIEMTSSHSTEFPAGHILKFFCRTPTTAGEYMTEVITTISVKNSEETKITLNLPQGAIEWKPQQTIFCRINFTELNIRSNQQESIDEASVLIAIQNYLRQQRTHHRYAINRVRLDNYRQQGNRHIGNAANKFENINDYFYPLSQPALLYTANNDQTIFNDSSQRSNVVNIDGISRLLIIGSREQKNHQHFTVNITALNYAVLQIAHRGMGFLHCYLPQQPAAMGYTITRKGQHLLLFITHQMLIINDVFDPRKNTAHSRLEFIFTHGSITASELASYYNTCNNNTDIPNEFRVTARRQSSESQECIR